MRKIVLSVLTALFCAVVFSACSSDDNKDKGNEKKLATPSLSYEILSETGFKVSWNLVENAASYAYELDGKADGTAETYVEFNDLEAGSLHVVKVKAVAVLDSEYTDSEWAEITVDLSEAGKTKDFDVTYNVEGTVVYVEVKPADKQMTYYSDVISEADYQKYGATPEKGFQYFFDSYKIFGDSAFEIMKDQGDLDYFMDMDQYGLKGYILTAGIDENLNITTAVDLVPFETDPLPHSDMTFEIDLVELGPAKAVFEITPSNNDPYTMVLMEKDDLEGYSEADIISLFSKEYSAWIKEHLYQGEMSMTYTTDMFPDTDYILFVFGWDTAPITDLNTYEFRTEKAVDDGNMTFEFSVNMDNPEELKISVVPSEKDALYYSNIIEKSVYETYGPDNILGYVKSICDMGGLPLEVYFEWFSSVGDTEMTFLYSEGEYEYDTEYVLVACPLTMEGDDVYLYPARVYENTIIVPSK